ncbi:hypothetical protein AB0N16_20225 [Streptomyces sp. NPDC051105]|uniref:hypothetical protein n=1 Tax=Streptomyces sp. NPDC051105 TaxID=3154843 RepID=UPI00341931B4
MITTFSRPVLGAALARAAVGLPATTAHAAGVHRSLVDTSGSPQDAYLPLTDLHGHQLV